MICRLKRGVHRPAAEQRYIYAVSQMYHRLAPANRERIRQLCRQAAPDYEEALLEYVTTDCTDVSVTMQYHMSEATLCRAVRRYFAIFPVPLE